MGNLLLENLWNNFSQRLVGTALNRKVSGSGHVGSALSFQNALPRSHISFSFAKSLASEPRHPRRTTHQTLRLRTDLQQQMILELRRQFRHTSDRCVHRAE